MALSLTARTANHASLAHRRVASVPLRSGRSRCAVAPRCSAEPVAPAVAAAAPAALSELNQDTFYPYLEAAGDKLVVVDFYTDWCGPCKMIYPELVKLADELKVKEVDILKFNCNKQNKDLGKQLQIKVAPTFHLYRNKNKVAEMTGAKVDKLRQLINEQQLAAGKPAIQ